MSIIRDYTPITNNRSSEDVRRHKEKVKQAIKENMQDIISNQGLIGSSGDKKIKIPIRGIKEYQFIYGKNNGGVLQGKGEEKRGDVIGEDKDNTKGKGTGAGNNEGDEYYEVEVTLDEIINELYEDLELPDIDKKKLKEVISQKFRRLGYQVKGIHPRLAKKKSLIEKIKREQAIRRSGKFEEDDEVRIPFSEDDLRYHRIKPKITQDSCAVVICIMDVSGSMDTTKKYLARSFYFLLYQFLKLKYENVEVVFIAHTTTAKEVTEDEFFNRGESGGTYISSGLKKALEIIEQRYNPESWNIYAFHCSDGENWSEDNNRMVEYAKKLCNICNLFGYAQILMLGFGDYISVRNLLIRNLTSDKFVPVIINKKEDVLPGIKGLLKKEGGYENE